MTILENHSNRLVVQVTSYRRGLLIAGTCWLIGLVFAFSASATTFACKRVEPKEGYCELIITGILNSSTQRFGLEQIEKVRTLTSTTTSRGRQLTDYSIQLQTTSRDVEIIKTGSMDEQRQWVDQTSAFLSNTVQKELILSQDSRIGLYVASMVMLGLWIVIVNLRVTTYIFDRTSSKLIIEQRLIGRWIKEYPLNDIRDLEISLYDLAKDDRKSYWRIYIKLKSDRYIATNLPDEKDLIVAIQTFLGVNCPLP